MGGLGLLPLQVVGDDSNTGNVEDEFSGEPRLVNHGSTSMGNEAVKGSNCCASFSISARKSSAVSIGAPYPSVRDSLLGEKLADMIDVV